MSFLDVNNDELRKRAIFKLKTKTTKKSKSDTKKINLNKIQRRKNEISKNNSKLSLNILIDSYTNLKNLHTIQYSNSNYSDRLRYNTIDRNKNIKTNYINESSNTINQSSKKLAIVKDGIIYWLRKLYIIFPYNTSNINYNQNQYIFFYFPIKDINIKIQKKCLFREEGGEIFCNSLDNIVEEVKLFLKISNFYDIFKFVLYNEDYVLIKNDNQLMEKKDKYKILYIKIKKLSNEQINKKIKRCQFHRHHKKTYDFILKTTDKPLQIFTNKELKNKICLDSYFSSSIKNNRIINKKNSFKNISKTENDKNENIINNDKLIKIKNKIAINKLFINKNKNIFDEGSWSSFLNEKIHINNKNKNLNINSTNYKIFPKIFIRKFKNINLYEHNKYISEINSPIHKSNLKDFNKKYNIPMIKSKRLWISNTNENYNNIIPIKLSQKNININNKQINDINNFKTIFKEENNNCIYSLSVDQSHSYNEEIYDKTQINNDFINNYLNINNNYNKLINNDNENSINNYKKKLFKKKFILKESLLEKDPCEDAFNIKYKNKNEILQKTNSMKKNTNNTNNTNNSFINHDKNKQINNIIEINQIQFIALNNCIRSFILEKIDTYITDEEISKLYNKELILKNIKEINTEIPVNIYLKEFFCFTYISNYIKETYPEFCKDFYEELKDYYININNILSIFKFKEFIFNLKNVFHEIKFNKLLMIEKLKQNYNKNNNKISFVFFILFMIYNKKNLSTLFDKELLFSFLECIDIHFCNEINIEQFIKFKIFFIKNKWINNEMKKIFVNKFFNYYIYENKNFDDDLFIIKLRPVLNIDSEDIKKIAKNKIEMNNNFDKIYNKFIEYFNF